MNVREHFGSRYFAGWLAIGATAFLLQGRSFYRRCRRATPVRPAAGF